MGLTNNNGCVKCQCINLLNGFNIFYTPPK